jgi:hypothetical protein
VGRGNWLKENGGTTNSGRRRRGSKRKLSAKNVMHTAVVILAHSEYVQFHIVMIDTVHLGTQLPQCSP